MKHSLAVIIALTFTAPAFAYQVTGPVLEVTDTKIVVEKDKEKWEITRDTNTKTNGNVKKGDKVTVEYSMTASKITVK